MDLGLRERVAIVGGSSKGMGRAVAVALAKEGASITLCARNEVDLRKAELEVARVGSQHHVLAVPCDLTRLDGIRRVVRATFNRFGRLDIVVNNIGDQLVGRPSQMNDEELEDDLEQNFLSIVRMSREAVPYMKQQQWGRIINRLSIAMREPQEGPVLSESSRLAVVGFSKMLSIELAPFNITVNNVLPGHLMTERMCSHFEEEAQDQLRPAIELIKEDMRSVPMGRLGKPEEFADLVTFLASERSSFITGATIPLDGGASQAVV